MNKSTVEDSRAQYNWAQDKIGIESCTKDRVGSTVCQCLAGQKSNDLVILSSIDGFETHCSSKELDSWSVFMLFPYFIVL